MSDFKQGFKLVNLFMSYKSLNRWGVNRMRGRTVKRVKELFGKDLFKV